MRPRLWRAFLKATLLLVLLGRPVPRDLEEAFPREV